LGIDELVLSVQLEDVEDLAYVSFSKDELAVFMATDHGVYLFLRLNNIN